MRLLQALPQASQAAGFSPIHYGPRGAGSDGRDDKCDFETLEEHRAQQKAAVSGDRHCEINADRSARGVDVVLCNVRADNAEGEQPAPRMQSSFATAEAEAEAEAGAKEKGATFATGAAAGITADIATAMAGAACANEQTGGKASIGMDESENSDGAVTPLSEMPVKVECVTVFVCDVCKVAEFADYDTACRHEEACRGKPDLEDVEAQRADTAAVADARM